MNISMPQKVALAAVQALIWEAATAPKPGLVSPQCNGAHKDMNFSLLVISALSLRTYFYDVTHIGWRTATQPPTDVFALLRKRGKLAEKAMFAATSNVNTHKGLIFSLGLLCAAVGRLAAQSKARVDSPQVVCACAAQFVQGICQQDFAHLHKHDAVANLHDADNIGILRTSTCSAGEKLYYNLGVRGARGEAEAGFPSVLEAFRIFTAQLKHKSMNDALVHTLITLMTQVEDTNVLHRAGQEGLAFIQKKAWEILYAGGLATDTGRQLIAELCGLCICRNISPGGSADLIGMALFLHLIIEMDKHVK